MTKPFHKDELVARIHAVVRRSKGHAQSVIKTGDITVNLDAKTVDVNGARVHLTSGSWFAALPGTLAGRVDLVVANPPYVAEDELAGLDPGVRDWEPVSALVAADGATGVGGMADVEAIVAGAPGWLRPGGALVVEIAPHQADAAVDAARRAGFGTVRTEPTPSTAWPSTRGCRRRSSGSSP